VNSGVPLDASTLNTGAASARPPVTMRTPAAFISATRDAYADLRRAATALVRNPYTQNRRAEAGPDATFPIPDNKIVQPEMLRII
jgi:hypothetical protein